MVFKIVTSEFERELEEKSVEEMNQFLSELGLSPFGYKAIFLLSTLNAYERIYTHYLEFRWEQ